MPKIENLFVFMRYGFIIAFALLAACKAPNDGGRDFLVANMRMGPIDVCGRMNAVEDNYTDVKDTTVYYRDANYDGQIVYFNSSEWLLALGSATQLKNPEIAALRTNAKKFRTVSGLKVGMTIADVRAKDIDFTVEIHEDISLYLEEDAVWIKIDKSSEDKFLRERNNSDDPSLIDDKAVITEFILNRENC